MPRNVRNFWIEVHADGRKPIATGPQSSSGGARVVIRNRREGSIDEDVTEVRCVADGDDLRILIYSAGVLIAQRTVQR